jgi:hypothetical protein
MPPNLLIKVKLELVLTWNLCSFKTGLHSSYKSTGVYLSLRPLCLEYLSPSRHLSFIYQHIYVIVWNGFCFSQSRVRDLEESVKELDNLYSQNFVEIGISKIIQTLGNTKCKCPCCYSNNIFPLRGQSRLGYPKRLSPLEFQHMWVCQTSPLFK